jgi:hypothetical protein
VRDADDVHTRWEALAEFGPYLTADTMSGTSVESQGSGVDPLVDRWPPQHVGAHPGVIVIKHHAVSHAPGELEGFGADVGESRGQCK